MPVWTLQWTKSFDENENIVLVITILDAAQNVLLTASNAFDPATSAWQLLGWVRGQCQAFAEQALIGNPLPAQGSLQFGFPAVWPIQV
jgi:hypothetical protein